MTAPSGHVAPPEQPGPPGQPAPVEPREPRTAAARRGLVDRLLDPPRATYGFAVLRVLLGCSVLGSLLANLPVRHHVWGDGARWARAWPDHDAWPWPFTVLGPDVPAAVLDAGYALTVLVAALFVLGWRTRWTTPVLLVLLTSLLRLSPLALDASDNVVRITLVYLCFARVSEHWSLDAVLRGRRAAPAGPAGARAPDAPGLGTVLHNLAWVLVVVQTCVIYLVAGLMKLLGTAWLDGTAVAYAAGNPRYVPWPALTELLLAAPGLVALSTWVALGTQLLFPLLVLWRPTRAVVLLAAVAMHVGIAVLLGLPFFSLAMLALDAALVRDATYRALARRVGVPLRARRRPARVSGA